MDVLLFLNAKRQTLFLIIYQQQNLVKMDILAAALLPTSGQYKNTSGILKMSQFYSYLNEMEDLNLDRINNFFDADYNKLTFKLFSHKTNFIASIIPSHQAFSP